MYCGKKTIRFREYDALGNVLLGNPGSRHSFGPLDQFGNIGSLIYDDSTSQLTGLKGSAANIHLVESIPQQVRPVLAARRGPTAHILNIF